MWLSWPGDLRSLASSLVNRLVTGQVCALLAGTQGHPVRLEIKRNKRVTGNPILGCTVNLTLHPLFPS